MKDYSELEGKEVVFKTISAGDINVVVTGCDFDIGITMVDKDDKNNNRLCFNGLASPNKEDLKTWDNADQYLKVYKASFYSVINGIKKGIVRQRTLMNIKNLLSDIDCKSSEGILQCAFNQ